MSALVEYLVRARFIEPADDPATPPERRIGETMHGILGDLEIEAQEVEIVSRVVLAGPDQPSRVRCAARSLHSTRHYATSTR